MISIVTHIFLNHCWICEGTASLHNHHIIPQAYGGVDGPQVTLCASCHNGVHHVADGRIDMRPDYWATVSQIEKSNTLIYLIQQARSIASGSDNKQITVTLILTAKEAKMLDAVKRILGSSSRVSTIKTLIDLTYQRLTKRG